MGLIYILTISIGTPFFIYIDVLVIPKERTLKLFDLGPRETCDFLQLVQTVQKVMEEIHRTRSSTMSIQDGPAAGQTVHVSSCFDVLSLSI